MRKGKFAPAKPVYQPPSQLVWTEDKLATLDSKQLLNLLENLHTQRGCGRVAEETATELEQRIQRTPARARHHRAPPPPRSEVMLEARVAEQLGGLAAQLAARYDLSPETATRMSAGTKGFRTQSIDRRKGIARAGSAVKREPRRSIVTSPAACATRWPASLMCCWPTARKNPAAMCCLGPATCSTKSRPRTSSRPWPSSTPGPPVRAHACAPYRWQLCRGRGAFRGADRARGGATESRHVVRPKRRCRACTHQQ